MYLLPTGQPNNHKFSFLLLIGQEFLYFLTILHLLYFLAYLSSPFFLKFPLPFQRVFF